DDARDVVDDAEDADHRGRVDGRVDAPRLPRAVVQGDVAAGDGDAELEAGVGEAGDALHELPHRVRVLGRAEVEAVRDGARAGAHGRDVAVRLGERELRARVRVELGVPAVAVDRERDPEPGGLVDADDAGVVGLGERGVALDEPVVLVGDPRLRGEVRGGDEAQQGRAELVPGRGPRVAGLAVGPGDAV